MWKTKVTFENHGTSGIDFIGFGVDFEVPGGAIGADAVEVDVNPGDVTALSAAVMAKRPAMVITVGETYDDGVTPDSMPYRKDNLAAVTNPGVTNDSSEGYEVESIWINTAATPREVYVCADATEGAAIWLNTTLEESELGTMAAQDADDVNIEGGLITGTAINIIEKTPVNAVAASKILTVAAEPAEGETVSIGGQVYKFRRTALGAGVKATAVLTSDETEVVDGDTVTVNDITYRFKDTMAAANDVKRNGTTADTTLANLVAAVNGSGTEGVEYYAGTEQAAGVVAGAVTSHAITFTADVVGFAANLFSKAATSIHLDFDGEGAVFTGGIDAEAANDIYSGGTAEIAIDNLVKAVTDVGTEGTHYGTGTAINASCTAAKASAATMTATAKTKGVVGNAIVLAETLGNASSKWAVDATALSGGIDGTVGLENEICVDATYLYHCIAANTIADANWRRVSLGSY